MPNDGASGRMAGSTVKIVEVGPRDGLQNEAAIIDTATKARFIHQLADAGLKQIEVTSFVHPKAIPQLSDAVELIRLLEPFPGVVYSALVPNMKGLERAMEAGIQRIAVFTAASDAFTRKNINMTIEESLAAFNPVVQTALANGMSVRGYVSTAFYCPYAGKIDSGPVLDVTRKLFEMGIDEVSIGDTIGRAVPEDIHAGVSRLLASFPVDRLAMHFHNTNGQALENVRAALELGIRTFDASAGGLGGCPYAPGASGNLSTNDLVNLLDGMGFHTGVDAVKLQQAAALIGDMIHRDVVSGTDCSP